MVEERIRKHFDYILFGIVMALTMFGCLIVFSAVYPDLSAVKFVRKQVIWIALGMSVLVFVAHSDYRSLDRYTRGIYIMNVLLLLAVKFIGREAKGSQRWISLGFFDLQPSELAKIALIITLASFLLVNRDRIQELKTVLWSLAHIGFPALLILKQPDLGTSLVLIAIWFGMAFISGARFRHLLLIVLVGILGFAVMWHSGFLKDYQKNRITSFIDPASDPRATGWHVRQSLVAIGSGEVFGKGLFRGSQNRLHFIPEQHTDFVFTVIGEELGFGGAMVTLVLYSILLWRILHIMAESEDYFGRMIACGVLSMFAFHVIENLGMTIGIMPVAGVPLPFVSYGGSAMIVNLSAIGLVESIHLRRHKIMF